MSVFIIFVVVVVTLTLLTIEGINMSTLQEVVDGIAAISADLDRIGAEIEALKAAGASAVTQEQLDSLASLVGATKAKADVL